MKFGGGTPVLTISDPQLLETKLSMYFMTGHYTTFQRQLNNYGWRQQEGPGIAYLKVTGPKVFGWTDVDRLRPLTAAQKNEQIILVDTPRVPKKRKTRDAPPIVVVPDVPDRPKRTTKRKTNNSLSASYDEPAPPPALAPPAPKKAKVSSGVEEEKMDFDLSIFSSSFSFDTDAKSDDDEFPFVQEEKDATDVIIIERPTEDFVVPPLSVAVITPGLERPDVDLKDALLSLFDEDDASDDDAGLDDSFAVSFLPCFESFPVSAV